MNICIAELNRRYTVLHRYTGSTTRRMPPKPSMYVQTYGNPPGLRIERNIHGHAKRLPLNEESLPPHCFSTSLYTHSHWLKF